MSDRPIRAWHFTRPGGVLGYGDPRIVVPGETLSNEGPVELCFSGLHASRRIMDALDHMQWSDGMPALRQVRDRVSPCELPG